MRKRILFTLAGLLTAQLFIGFNKVDAQIPCKIEHYSTEEGLSNDVITCIHKDREGFMWFGTWDGINRFDGYSFMTYRSIAGDSSQLKNNRIDHITEDNLGRLWLKSFDGEIYQFDKRKERFTSLRSIISLPPKIMFTKVLPTPDNELWIGTKNQGVIVIPNLKKAPSRYVRLHTGAASALRLPADSISVFYNHKNGSKWIGTTHGLVCVTKQQNGALLMKNIKLPLAGSPYIKAISNHNDTLFITTATGQLLVYDIKRAEIAKVIETGATGINGMKASALSTLVYATTKNGELYVIDVQKSTVNKYNSGETAGLRSIFEDSHGNLWLEPARRGVVFFSVANRGFRKFEQRNDAYSKIPMNHFKVFEDNEHRVWAVLRDGGFGYYDHKTSAFEYFYNEPGAKNRRMSNLVATTYYDNAGIMWLHTDQRGVDKIIFAPNNFRQELPNETGMFKSDNEVRGLLSDHLGRLWVGTKSSKLYLIKDGKKQPLPFVNIPAEGLGAVYRIYEDSHKNLWICTKEDGLFMARPLDATAGKYTLTQFGHSDNDERSISSNQIYSVLEDAQGRIWVGSFDKGLCIGRWENGKLSFKRYGQAEGYPDAHNKIRHMMGDAKGRVWMGTTNGLIIANQTRQGKMNFHTYSKRPGDANSLGNNDVQYILRDSQNQMWLATSGGGLNLVTESKPFQLSFKAFITKDGLANDYILSCIEDRDYNLWMTTKSSISRFNVSASTFRNFNSFDGVPHFGFSEGACQKLPDGRIVFGSIQGLIYFDPARVKEHPVNANLVFTDLQVNNKQVNIGDETGILQSAVNTTNHITLKHDQNILSFDYTLLDHRFNNRSTYVYQLKGFDTGWQQNHTQRRATYTNLPPGDYTFEVKSADDGMYLNGPSKKISITILPPWYKTWWAYLIYVAVAVALLELARRTATTMLRLRHKVAVEKKMADLKLNFFTNVSHELRTPLTLISNPVEQVLRTERLSEDGRHYLTVVKRNVNRMERYVNQLLDLRKLQSGKAKLDLCRVEFIGFIQGIGDCFSGISTGRNICFELRSVQNTMDVWIDPDKMETVLYNVIGNAFKFSRKNSMVTVEIEAAEGGEMFTVVISDQGCGVPEYDLPHIFELYHESNHAEVRGIKGTGIGLALAKELVELHGGTINAVNCSQGGFKVCIQLPVSNGSKNAKQAVNTINNDTILVDVPVPISAAEVQDVNNEIDTNQPVLLLVEDNDDMRDFLCRQLSAHFQVKTAENGEDGLALAFKIQPDLILSDVMMPKMDGIEMLAKLKHDQRTSHIPVVLLSAKSAVESQIAGLEFGADRYITKPFNNDLLLASIKSLLKQRLCYAERLTAGHKVMELAPGEIIVTPKDELFLQKVIGIIEDRMAEPEFNIDTVAELLNMARPTFYKKFKSLTQKAPVEFVRDIRLQRARQYLDSGVGNIKEISYTVGFSSSRYFSTCFKAKYHKSPSDYLKKLTEVDNE